MDVVVSGATGFIGSALCASLAADGHRVARLVRPASRVGAVGAGPDRFAATIAWDPDAGTIDAGALEGADAVVHLAGAGIGDARWTAARKRLILESRTRGTSVLARALAGLARPPAVLVTSSAVGYYGDRGADVLTEDSAPGTDFLARVCVQWEDAARPAAEAGVRVAWARIGVVLDPRGGVLARMLWPFRLGLGGRIGPGTQYLSWITLADTVAAIRRVIDDRALGGPVNLTAPNPVTNAEFAATLGRVLGRPARLPTPLLVLKARYGAELVEHLLLSGQRVRPQKLLDAGFEFATPELERALRAVLARPRAEGA